MANVIEATFDGKAFLPDEPVELEPNTRVRIAIQPLLPENGTSVSFFSVARSLRVDGPPDWSENLDKYLYGHLADSVGERYDENTE